MKCRECEHFKIVCMPDMPWNWGLARCLKHDLTVEFPNMRKINKLQCVDKSEEKENVQVL